MTDAVCTKLPARASIILSGPDREAFLQGLITQDINLLDQQPLIYACLLTPQGKFLFDFFIRRDGETLVIDCEGGERAAALLKRLSMYKLRSNVALDLQDNADVWQVWKGDDNGDHQDPRHKSCGSRNYKQPKDAKEVDFDIWDEYRIRHEIPDGSRDLIPEKSFIHESEIVSQKAISYKKGCYVGQELVSRMHHRGLVKKVLKCIMISEVNDLNLVRSRCGQVAMALTKHQPRD